MRSDQKEECGWMDIKMDNHTVETKRQMGWMLLNLKVKTHILASDLTGHTAENAQEVVKVRYKIAQIKKSNIEIRSVSELEADCRQFNMSEIQQLLQETANVKAKNRKSALSKMKVVACSKTKVCGQTLK